MNETLFRNAIQRSRRRRRTVWKRCVRAMAAVVVFCTVYALVLPAVTIGDTPICGLEPHVHTDQCWRSQTLTAVCPATGELVLHTHDEGCYDDTGTLWCPLPEQAGHLHTGECMQEQQVLTCPLSEIAPHTHDESCTGQVPTLSCGLEESPPHLHSDSCYVTQAEQSCTEEHEHTVDCFTTQTLLTCTLAETEGHIHTDTCYTPGPGIVCGLEETQGHSHQDGCYETRLFPVCGLEQLAEHSHDETCLDENGVAQCGITPATVHIHSENCSLVTQLPERELICPLAEHEHTDACYPQPETLPTEEGFLCGIGAHTHADGCHDENGELTCTLSQHIHTAPCLVKDYDGTADMETPADWEATLSDVTLTGSYPTDLLAIARSQLGYRESSRNVWLCEDGSLKGYTRYGGWYGVPYGDWCAMFVSFCVKYANATEIPTDSVCNHYIDKLTEAGMYRTAGDYIPKPGDIIFLDWEVDGNVDHTGFVAEIIRDENGDPTAIKTIEGNSDNAVRYQTYPWDDPMLLGYGEVPMGGGKVLVCEDSEHTHDESCYGVRLFFQDDAMEASLTITGMAELPQNLTLSIVPVTEDDPMTYGAMNAAVELEMEQTPYFAEAVSIYQVCLLSGGEEFTLPDGAQAWVDVTFSAPLFDAAAVAEGSGLRTFLLSQGEPITLFSGETVDTYAATQTLGESYTDAQSGLTGISLALNGQSTFAVAQTSTTLEGTFWTRVTSKDELNANGTYMIVSAEGNLALRGNSSTNYMWVELQTVKGNESYYTITPRSSSDTINNTLYWTFTPSGSGYHILNQGNSTYLLGSSRQYWDSLTILGSYAKVASATYVTPENCWRIYRNSSYLRNTGSGSFGTTTSADKTIYNTPHYYTRDMMIFKLSDVTALDVPEDVVRDPDNNPVIPEKPDYDPLIEPSTHKQGDTSLTLNNVTVPGKFYSDKPTSNIEKKFHLESYKAQQEVDGKILTDKSVIYGDDDYDAFASYPANTFGITLSAVGQEYEMPHEDIVRTPIDVVFVLDVSGSMTVNPATNDDEVSGDGTSASRASAMVDAVNKAIRQIMKDHKANRVGVVLYATGAWELLPLDRYVTDTDDDPTNDTYLQINAITGPMQNDSNYTKEIHFVETTASLKSESGIAYPNIGTGFNQGYGTYTQAGIAMGGKTFANIGGDVEYTVTFGEDEEARTYTVNRQPVMILLSDGEPTHATNLYMDPLSGPHYGDGKSFTDNAKGIMGYNVILTANYFKRMMGIQYQQEALFYTVGMGINETGSAPLHGGDTSDAYKRAVLNPTPENIEALNSSMTGGSVVNTQLKQLINGSFTDKTVQVYTYWPDPWTGIPHIIMPTLLKNPYADDYSYANAAYFGDLNAAALEEIFSHIIKMSMKDTPYGFILHKASAIQISDIIGTDMEIKGVPVLRYQGVNYHPVEVIDDGFDVQYIYKGTYTHPYLKDRVYNLEDIVVKVITDDHGHQVVTMYIPDTVLPVFTPELIGKQFYYQALPVRLIYQVGLTDYAQQQVANLYKTGGTLTYYTNRYEEGIEQAISNLYPSMDNPFYYKVLENGLTRYEPHQDMKAPGTHVTDTLNYQITCTKAPEYVDGEIITKVVHMHGNNGKLVFEVPDVDIPVEKQWSGSINPTQSVEVDIYNVQTTSTGKEEATLIKTVTLSAANNWEASFKDMPILTTGYYAIAERVPENFQAQYSGETKTLVIDNHNVLVAVVDLTNTESIPVTTVTNTLQVVLPATGGMGAFPYYTMGALLMAAALWYLVGYIRARRKESS